VLEIMSDSYTQYLKFKCMIVFVYENRSM